MARKLALSGREAPMDIFGTSGHDSIVGTVDPDLIDLTQGGRDTVQAGDGDDTVTMGDELSAFDQLDGGDGYDTLILDGGYAAGVVFQPSTLTNFEELQFERNHDYDITFDDATAAGGGFFYIRAALLGVNDSLVFDGSAETDTHFDISDGHGSDVLIGSTNVSSTIRIGNGGDDTVTCGQASDTVWVYGGLSSGDIVDGGPGIDSIRFGGDYSAGLTITGAMLISVEKFTLSPLFDYDLVLTDDIVRPFIVFPVNIESIGSPAGHDIVFDGSAETDGYWDFDGGISDDTLIGGALADTFDMANDSSGHQEGLDAVHGNAGDDLITFNETFTRDDQVDGGADFDELVLEGDYSGGVVFRAATLTDVELVTLTAGHSYDLTVSNPNVRADGFTVDGSALAAPDTLTYDGTAESASNVVILGGGGADVVTLGAGDDSVSGGLGADSIIGGAGDDTLRGNEGKDTLEGGLGLDHVYGDKAATTFVFAGVADSTGDDHDVLGALKPLKDHFDLDVAVTGVDARVNAGSLSVASFDADLAAEIDAAALAAGHAMVFKPNAGDLAGHFFLVVDANGVAGYQAGADYVMEFAAGSNPNAIAVGFFV
jgi:Ca2+-binding RTX toxin-like protein